MSKTDYSKHVKSMNTGDLIRWMSGLRPGTEERLAGEHELVLRRARGGEVRGWLAIGISVVSLVIAILAYFKK